LIGYLLINFASDKWSLGTIAIAIGGGGFANIFVDYYYLKKKEKK